MTTETPSKLTQEQREAVAQVCYSIAQRVLPDFAEKVEEAFRDLKIDTIPPVQTKIVLDVLVGLLVSNFEGENLEKMAEVTAQHLKDATAHLARALEAEQTHGTYGTA